MTYFEIAPQAQDDLDAIWEYIAAASIDAADRLLDSFRNRLELLTILPGSGTPRNDLLPNLRSVLVGNYVMFYTTIADGILLLRVLHGARDIPTIFNRENIEE